MSLDQRLDDIAWRYGSESKQFIQAKQLACEIDDSLEKLGLDLWGFAGSLELEE